MCWKLIFSVTFVFGLCGSIACGQENQIINGEFDDGLNSWNTYGAAGFNLQVVQGAALSGNNAIMVDISDASAGTAIGFAQGGLGLVEGQTYPIGFTAKAEQDREMVVLFQIYKTEIPQWITPWETTVQLTTDPQSFKFEYLHESETTTDHPEWSVDIYFMLKGTYWPMDGDDLNVKVWVDRIYFGAETLSQRLELATAPSPEDGALLAETWVGLTWMPSDFAVSHDVYLGDNFDDVNNGLGDTFRTNQKNTDFVVGFPGYPYPDGLVPGTTYYWRIDEVNEADPNSPWKGPVWSFTVPPRNAYAPNPPDGDKFVDPEAVLSWKPGLGAKLHTVHFGDNFDDVNNAGPGAPQSLTTYKPGTLERKKTYYWRVDEFDGATTRTGDVWSFTVAREGGGLKAEYFDNTDLAGEPVLTRVDPQVDFDWGSGTVAGENSPDASVPVDNFSARWSGELEVDITDTYTFSIVGNNGFRLYLDGRLIIDYWDNPATEDRRSDPIELAGGTSHSVLMEYYEGTGAAVVQLYWAGTARQEQIIPQAALSLPVKANTPSPANGVLDAHMTTILTWSPGDTATSHEIYFGTDANAVKNATTASPEYKGTRPIGSENYDPGTLAWDTTYYWRIDEVDNTSPDGRWTGNLWSFKTADFIVIDDFEDYDAGENQIWYSWHDGLGYGTPTTLPYFAGNGTGSSVGDETTASYTEETIVHGGVHSMPFFYDNNKQGYAYYSEIDKTLTYPRDWTQQGVSELSLWFYGDPANDPELMYVAVSNRAGQPAIVVHNDPAAAQIDAWTQWLIPLQSFAGQGVDLTDVDKIAIGFGTRGNLTITGGSGRMLFDDIRLY